MFKGDKYFELMEAVKSLEVIRVYKNRNFFIIYLTGLANKGFTLLLTFSSISILTGLGVLSDALLNRRSHNDALMALEMRFFFQLNRVNAAQ
jgi:hypothetical protein